jgi:hypothetical protein
MKLKSWIVAVIVVAVMFGGIAVSAAFNIWRTTSNKIPATIDSGEFAGQANPSDIRGSYTFQDVQNAFEVPVEVLAKAFGVAHLEDPASFKCKQLEETYAGLEEREIGTDSVRLFVALYKGLPHTPEDSTALPNPAVFQLKHLGTLTEEQLTLLEQIKVDVSGFREEAGSTEEHAESEERTVLGKTTFGELLEWGLKREDIEAVFGMEIGARGTTMRDFCADKGIEFSGFKTALQEKVDSIR